MENTFVDSKDITGEINSALDFITVRNSNMGLVFMGERKNIKCFDRLKKVSERVFETLAGQTYRFLDKMPEPKKEPEVTIEPGMLNLAEASFLHYQTKAGQLLPIVKQPEPAALMTLEEQVQHDWKSNPGIRKEFLTFGSYQSYKRAAVAGKVKVHVGIGGSNRDA